MLQLLTLYSYVTFLETFLADTSSEEPPIQTETDLSSRRFPQTAAALFSGSGRSRSPVPHDGKRSVLSESEYREMADPGAGRSSAILLSRLGKTITICRRKTRLCTKAWLSTWIKNSGSPVRPKTAMSPEPALSFPAGGAVFPRAAGKPQRQTELVPSHR